MHLLISVTKSELDIIVSRYSTKKRAFNAMVEDMILSTSYESLEDIQKAAQAGECGISDEDAWAETNQFGTGQWKIVAIDASTCVEEDQSARDEFMDFIYDMFKEDPDNTRANEIITAADEYAEKCMQTATASLKQDPVFLKTCPMRHANGNCLPAGGFCTANKSICHALQNAYARGREACFIETKKEKGEETMNKLKVWVESPEEVMAENDNKVDIHISATDKVYEYLLRMTDLVANSETCSYEELLEKAGVEYTDLYVVMEKGQSTPLSYELSVQMMDDSKKYYTFTSLTPHEVEEAIVSAVNSYMGRYVVSSSFEHKATHDPEEACLYWCQMQQSDVMNVSIQAANEASAFELIVWAQNNFETLAANMEKYKCPYKREFMKATIDEYVLKGSSSMQWPYDQVTPFDMG